MKTKELATMRLSRLFECRVVKFIVVDKTKEKRFSVGVATFGKRLETMEKFSGYLCTVDTCGES